ncbi:hypothetical protein DXG01_000499 [Tephrocybe rancida]|nr:hypothetical protein DXG01_000499 [Tephrocybe rancida]
MSELLPVSTQAPVFATNDVVPFRCTPNMQHFVGPIFMEGILTSGILAIDRSLTEPEFELEQSLLPQADVVFRTNVAANINGVVKRCENMTCKVEREQAVNNGNIGTVPVIQTVTNLISGATNPIQLAKMGEMYHPWF